MRPKPGDLAIVVRGMWPNVGRIVYVDKLVDRVDFRPMGLPIQAGWRVRAWSNGPLVTVAGMRMAGYTPIGSLRRLDPLPTEQQRSVMREMAVADFRAAMKELADLFEREAVVAA